jgi:hypothetical protein
MIELNVVRDTKWVLSTPRRGDSEGRGAERLGRRRTIGEERDVT